MTQIVSRPMLTYIFNFSWTKKCSLERQLLIVFVVEVASVQYKHLIVFVFVLEVFNTNSGKPRRGLGVTVEKIRWR